MTVSANGATREDLLAAYGRYYGEERFAIAFTASIHGDNAKRVTTEAWDKTPPLATPDYGAGLVSQRGLTHNVAVVLRPSNLIVLECDTEEDLVRIEGLKLPHTLTVRSSKPYKRHFYFRPAAELEQIPYVAFRFESGKLTSDSGRYFLAPPSIHPSGAIYSFIPGHGPGETDIAELPEQAYRMLAQQARVETDEQRHLIAVDPQAKIRAGNRRDFLFRYACMLRRWGQPREAILDACLAINDQRCDPPVERSLVEVQVDGAMKKRGDQEIQRALTSVPTPDYDDDPGPEPRPEERPNLILLPDAPGSSWTRINLNDPQYKIPPDPPSILNLLYDGMRHVISGLPESAKTLITYICALQAIRDGKRVAVIDFEMGPRAASLLLTELGATLDEIDGIYYVTPTEPPGTHLQAIIDWKADLVIVDAAVGAYDASDLDDNSRKDAEVFARTWIRPLWKTGITTVLLDHVTKDSEKRGKFTIGSERKVGQADVHLGMEAVKSLSRGGSGIIKVHVHKDRPAFLRRPVTALFELNSNPASHMVTWKIRDPHPTSEDTGTFRPTVLMEKVSRHLETLDEPVTRNQVERDIQGKAEYVRAALDVLTDEGYVHATDGPRNSRQVTIRRAYREINDTSLTTASDRVPTASETQSRPPRPLVPPLQGDGTGLKGQDEHDHVPEQQAFESWADDPELQRKLSDDYDYGNPADQ